MAPQAQRAVCFFAMVSFPPPIRDGLGGLDPDGLCVYKGVCTEV